MGSSTVKKYDITSWSVGTYYVTIQSIDEQGNGSPWSEEVVFEKKSVNADFEVLVCDSIYSNLNYIKTESAADQASTNDTVVVKLIGAIQSQYIYNWNTEGATVLPESNNSVLYLIYAKAGEKHISLTLTENGNEITSVNKAIQIFDYDIEEKRFDNDNVTSFSDIDYDGDIDLVFGGNGIFTNDGAGNFSKLAKIFNLDYQGYGFWMDYDMDGDEDIIDGDYATNSVDIRLNQGNSNFTLTEINDGYTVIYGSIPRTDYNNDGFLDTYAYSSDTKDYQWYHINEEGVQVKTEATETNISGTTPPSFTKDIDWNYDGFIDQWGSIRTGMYSSSNVGLHIKLNKEGYPSEINKIDLPVEINSGNPVLAVEDFDNDSDWDVLMRKNETTLVLWINNGYNQFNDSLNIKLPESWKVLTSTELLTHDVDNNGYVDVFIPRSRETINDEFSEGGIVYFNPNLKYICQKYNLPNGLKELWLDINNDKTPDFFNGSYYSYQTKSNTINLSPSAPTGIMANQTDTTLKITWQHGADTETPAVQMRYNLSVKKAGESGAGSFIVSPGNGLNANAALQPDRTYIRDNKFIMPINRFEAGEYEIQIQSIDLWNATSEFSPVTTIYVEAEPVFECPEEICFGAIADITYKGTTTSSIIWDFDGGNIVSGTEVGPYEITWDSNGVKTITATVDGKSYKQQINVLQQLDASFTMGDYLVSGTEEPFTVLENNNPNIKYNWNTSSSSVDILKQAGSTGTLTIFEEGTIDVTLQLQENGCQSESVTKTVTVLPKLPEPTPDIVSINSDGKNSISWDATQWPDYVTNVHIYKEGKVTNAFEEVATIEKPVGLFVDEVSMPDLNSERYYLVLEDQYGHLSNNGPVQETVLLTINKGLNSSVNLIWNAYQGIDIATYKVLPRCFCRQYEYDCRVGRF